jgi:hypothetical protein
MIPFLVFLLKIYNISKRYLKLPERKPRRNKKLLERLQLLLNGKNCLMEMKILTLRGVKTLMRMWLQVKEKRKTPANGKMINFMLCLKMFKMPSTMPN